MGAVVEGAVVGVEPVREAAEAVVVVLDAAGGDGDDGGAFVGEHVDALVGAST